MKENNKPKAEIDFKETIKNPLNWFGLFYPYILVVVLIIGIYYLNSLNDLYVKQPNPGYEDIGKVPVIEKKKGGPVPAADTSLIQNPTPEMLAKGKELYSQNCESCHGAEGLGNGPAGVSLNPPPRNFHNLEGWTNGTEFPQLYKTLQEGILQNGMAAYEYISPMDRIAIIEHVRSFADFPEISDAQVKEVTRTYNLAEEIIKPNTIPVDLAVQKIAEENAIKQVSDNSKAGSESILDKSSLSIEKVLSIFSKSGIPGSVSEFRNIVVSSPTDLGFKGSVVRLSDAEWSELYNSMIEKLIEEDSNVNGKNEDS